jgi:hypothetical protein
MFQELVALAHGQWATTPEVATAGAEESMYPRPWT